MSEISQPNHELIGATVADRYRVTRVLASGGMGSVLVAEQAPFGREVALKVTRAAAGDAAADARFERESRLIGQLQHPNIVSLFEAGTWNGVRFIAMELLPGESLRKRLKRGPVAWPETLLIVRDIASALGAAHRAGILHRDLKPDNVMLVPVAGERDFVKLLDFGIAKPMDAAAAVVDEALTASGAIVGTVGYIAPETSRDGDVTARSDLYALGVIWFEMLTGTSPFTGKTPIAVVMKHAAEPPPMPSRVRPDANIPDAVERLVLRLLSKDPLERPESAAQLAELIAGLPAPGASTSSPQSSQSSQPAQQPSTQSQPSALPDAAPTAVTADIARLPGAARARRLRVALAAAAGVVVVAVVGALATRTNELGDAEARCAAGDRAACRALLDAVVVGRVDERDFARLYATACLGGEVRGCVDGAALLRNSEPARAAALERSACALGHEASCPKPATVASSTPPAPNAAPPAPARAVAATTRPRERTSAPTAPTTPASAAAAPTAPTTAPPADHTAPAEAPHVPMLLR